MGVEHASFEDLQKALSGVLGSYDDNQFDISKSNLMKLGLLMGADSQSVENIWARRFVLVIAMESSF